MLVMESCEIAGTLIALSIPALKPYFSKVLGDLTVNAGDWRGRMNMDNRHLPSRAPCPVQYSHYGGNMRRGDERASFSTTDGKSHIPVNSDQSTITSCGMALSHSEQGLTGPMNREPYKGHKPKGGGGCPLELRDMRPS